ncbi:MAG: FAD-binding protein [Myxococcales bacterium]|nr:FAD-binding protein [Myxococcales bacterium]
MPANYSPKKLPTQKRILPKENVLPPRVMVFGAGIAGLTAAHELIERGFDVHVVEAAKGEMGEVAVGGIAKTQWACGDSLPDSLPEHEATAIYERYQDSLHRESSGQLAEAIVSMITSAIPAIQHLPFQGQLVTSIASLVSEMSMGDPFSSLAGSIGEMFSRPPLWSPHQDLHTRVENLISENKDEIEEQHNQRVRARFSSIVWHARETIRLWLQQPMRPTSRAKPGLAVRVMGPVRRTTTIGANEDGSAAEILARCFEEEAGPIQEFITGVQHWREDLARSLIQWNRALPDGARLPLDESTLKLSIPAPTADTVAMRSPLLDAAARGLRRSWYPPPGNDEVEPRSDWSALSESERAVFDCWLCQLLGSTKIEVHADSARKEDARIAERFFDEERGLQRFLGPYQTRLCIDEGGTKVQIGSTDWHCAEDHHFLLVFVPPQGALPGEHGYRYFPAFYRNLYDSLRRIPLYDEDGDETSSTVEDNLVGAPDLHLALQDDRPPLSMPRRRIRSFEELRKLLSGRWGRLGALPSDLHHLERKMLRYLSSSTARRERECQHSSWWDFLEGHRLSPRMQALLSHTPQALIAMSVEEIDARTHGNILTQLLMDHLRPAAEVDRTLNGPTSKTLLAPWKEHLLRQGVFFHGARLDSLVYQPGSEPAVETSPIRRPPRTKDYSGPGDERAEDSSGPTTIVPKGWSHHQIQPIVECHRRTEYFRPDEDRFVFHDYAEGTPTPLDDVVESCDYFVLALPYLQTLELARGLNEETDPHLRSNIGRAFRAVLHMGEPKDTNVEEPRPWKPNPQSPWSFLRLFSGVQFFFEREIRIGNGHVYYPGTPWGLSSISQPQFWRRHRLRSDSAFGCISVDIGNCSALSPLSEDAGIPFSSVSAGGGLYSASGGSAWDPALAPDPVEDSPDQFLSSLVEQSLPMEIAKATWSQVLSGLHRDTRERIPMPSRFYVDEGLRKYWSASYGRESNEPSARRSFGPWYMINLPSLGWSSRPGFYMDRSAYITNEAAIRILPGLDLDQSHRAFDPDRQRVLWYEVTNEHWVLAGAYNKTYTRIETMEAANESARHAVNAILDHWLRHWELAGIVQPMVGEYCDVWDPERNELEDLEALRRLDEMLVRDDLPHFMDILGLDTASGGKDSIASFLQLLDTAIRRPGSSGSSPAEVLQTLQGLLTTLRQS